MNKKDPKLVVLLFNECISNKDLSGLTKYMKDDVIFIEGDEAALDGKEASKKAWNSFFSLFPDYKNNFNRIESRDSKVIMVGFSTCSNKTVAGPMLWIVKVENDLIKEWRILNDTEENRLLLDISG